MIRTLLGSTALLSAVIFYSPAYAAKTSPTPMLATPQIKFSGQTSFNSYFFKNHKIFQPGNAANTDCSRKKFGRGQLFAVDNSRLKIAVDGKTDPGMDYGLVFVFDGNVDASNIAREAYLFFGGTWGKVYAGDTYGVQNTMAFGGYDQWGGTGFIDASPDRVVNFTTGAPKSVDLLGDAARDTKLTYLSPRWNGLQAGISYTPRTEHRGEQQIEARRSVSSPRKPFSTDNIASGVNFIHKFASGFEMGLSATSIFAQAHSEYRSAPNRKNVASYAFGGTFEYVGVGFSAEYGNNGRSYQFKQGGRKSTGGQFVDFGLSYKWGPSTKISAGYYYGWRNALGGGISSNFTKRKAKTKGLSAALDQKLAPGLGVYFEYAHYQLKNSAAVAEAARVNNVLDSPCGQYIGPVKSNRANVFIVGSRLVF